MRPGYRRVTLDGGEAAYALTDVVGEVTLGDEVVVETTAVDLGLGTGGAHIVHLNLTSLRASHVRASHVRAGQPRGAASLRYLTPDERDRLVVKARYLSTQVGVLAERSTDDDLPLAGVRVLLCGIHSHAMAAVVAAHDVGAGFSYFPADTSDSGEAAEPPALRRRVAYVMTDAGALPFALSDLAAELVARDLAATTISAGQSFGAAIESVNVVDAVGAAKARGVRRVVLAPGPGHVGTASRYGFSGLELAGQAALLAKLGATVALCVRASSVDGRSRHHGISHHTLTLAGLLPEAVTVVLPAALELEFGAAAPGVRQVVAPSVDVASTLARHRLTVTSMGAPLADDPLACAAVGAAAHWLAVGETAVRNAQTVAQRRSEPVAAQPVEDERESTGQEPAGEPADEPANGEPRPRLRSRVARQVLEWTLVVVLTLGLSLGLRAVVVGAFYIPSSSMEPTLTLGTRVLMNRLSYVSVTPQRGEVVVFGSPESVGSYAPAELIKRVVAVGGDTVEGRDGQLYVNGERQIEPYVAEPASTSDFAPVLVPAEHVFVMGDNRRNSQDSRAFGPVSLDDVRGRAFVRYWPPSNLGGL